MYRANWRGWPAARPRRPRRSRTRGVHLERAIYATPSGDQIEIVVHPLVDLGTGALQSFEALARWQHPVLGEISPEDFFAAAEQSGQVAVLSERILDRGRAIMASDPPRLRVGTRASRLALWQADHVVTGSGGSGPISIERVPMTTLGDRVTTVALSKIGDKGIFTRELEDGLRTGAIDLAVHSLKDLPTELPADLEIGAILERDDPRDVLVAGPGATIARYPPGRGSARRLCGVVHSSRRRDRISRSSTFEATCRRVWRKSGRARWTRSCSPSPA